MNRADKACFGMPGSLRSAARERLPWRIAIVAAIAFALCGASTLTPAQEPEQPSSSLSGTVVNSVTQELIGRALVFSPDNRFATMTDEHGHFELNLSSLGGDPNSGLSRPNMLLAKKPGYLDDRSKPAQVILDNTAKDLTIALTPESLIIGHIVFPDAAERAQVVLYRQQVQDGIAHWMQYKQVTSRSDGEFRFAGLSAGKYKVFTLESTDRDPLSSSRNAQTYEYPPAYFPNAGDFASAQAIELGTARTFVADLNPQRKPYYDVKIPILGGAQPGPPNIGQVTVYPQGHRGPGYQLGFNPQVPEIEGMMPDGTYTVQVGGYGQNSSSGMGVFTVHGGAVRGQPIVFVPDPSIPVQVREEFTASDQSQSGQGGSIVGRIQESGVPQSNQPHAYVYLQPADDFGPEHTVSMQSRGNEAPVIPGVSPGRYWVRADAMRGYVASLTSGGKDLLHQPLTVAPGVALQPIEVVLRDDMASVEGRVEGGPEGTSPSAGVPAAQVWGFNGGHSGGSIQANTYIYFVPLPDSPGRFMETGSMNGNGVFSLQMPPGAYRVMAFDSPQQIEYRSPEALRGYESKGQVVRLSPGQREQVVVQVMKSN